MSMNERLASMCGRMLSEQGFDVGLQQKTAASSDFDTSQPAWSDFKTVKGIWDVTRYPTEMLQDGRPASKSQLLMYVDYLDELKETRDASTFRVVYQGVAYNIVASSIVGKNICIRLTLDDGVPA
jgi:hypothetical protein